MTAPEVVRFGTFELDHSTGELRNRGKRISLQRQPAQVLSLLVRNPGKVVSRDELQRAVWAEDTFVEFDTALNVAVQKVRQALGDSATTPRFIETIPKQGYRFLADVKPLEPDSLPVDPRDPMPTLRNRGRYWRAVVLLLGALGVVIGLRLLRAPSLPSPRAVAVLPFKPLVDESRDEALELGMTEAVIVKLGQIQELRVPSLTAVRRFDGPDPLQAGRELQVDAVLDASLQRVEGSLRVSARLLDVRFGTSLWARQWDLPWTDVFTVQDAMATEVTRALALTLTPRGPAPLEAEPTNAEAYDRYLRGRHLVTRRTLQDSQRAAELLEEAVELDPRSAPAQAALADAYLAIPWLGGSTEPFVSKARMAALRAVELEPELAEAHATLGAIFVHFDWDPAAGEEAMRRALELGPDNPVVLRTYQLFLWQEGRFDEALALNDRELALDPTSVFANRNKAIILYYARRYEECVEQCLKTLELDRYFETVYDWLGKSYERLGREEEAVDAFITPLTFSVEKHRDFASLRDAAREGGLRGYWRRRLELELSRPHAHDEVKPLAYVRLGDPDQALFWLERLFEERTPWVRTLRVEPLWDPLRSDPRFKSLLRRANLIRDGF
jgi:DNA-binding winged helix-turn-helix (wHTH) protein/TolB-like protein/tetratricopeptide (TPR) repeat protein